MFVSSQIPSLPTTYNIMCCTSVKGSGCFSPPSLTYKTKRGRTNHCLGCSLFCNKQNAKLLRCHRVLIKSFQQSCGGHLAHCPEDLDSLSDVSCLQKYTTLTTRAALERGMKKLSNNIKTQARQQSTKLFLTQPEAPTAPVHGYNEPP